jgi:polyvinyl alcohol dehydrogenase (cytochrome)
VSGLRPLWTDVGGVSSFAQPIQVGTMVYWSDWTGVEHGTGLSGHDVWTTNLGTTTPVNACPFAPSTTGPTSTPTVVSQGGGLVLYVGGGNGVFYALDALTGSVIWHTRLGSSPDNFVWDSPALYNGTLYIGVASYGDCPLVQGKLFALDAATGSILATANMVPDGCVGGGVWSSPAIDPNEGAVWVTTGTPESCDTPGELAPSIVELRTGDLALISSWTVPAQSQTFDSDFGGTPTFFTATIDGVPRPLVGAVNKNGVFYALDRTDPAAGPVWQTPLALGWSDPGVSSIVSAAWDGSALYVGGGVSKINGTICLGSIDALDPATGSFLWRTCQDDFMYAGITVVPGIVIEGLLNGTALFLDAATGNTLFSYRAESGIQGEISVSQGVVYIPLADGSLVALGQ